MGGGIPAPTSAVAIPKNYLTDEDVIDRYHLQFPSVPKPQSNNNTYNNSNSVSSATQSISVHELLECPVCNNSMYPPIYQCRNGQTLCSTCKARVHNRCPTCRQELGDIRCLALEKIAECLKRLANTCQFDAKRFFHTTVNSNMKFFVCWI
ncbi:E3 ubiquitin-protein ligase SINAT3-like isoform X1 [Hevea brasiliensis]|uniref:E3 ubiquitin-protein ligase SINAT3-like isoform X1 n=1 Tax=Hevea brasiliensis TaxID=3981 RepID=UPI0025F94AB8|nr:E3 ubiquitin-protein ligase SINAT3-like isoform X1 [Hevea brasiliensis]